MSLTQPDRIYIIPSSGHKYSYIYHPPSSASKPTLLLLHGFPSTSYDWRCQITHFHSLGYGIFAPDLLGYGASSRPSSPHAYIGSVMSADIISILDYEGIGGESKIIGIAHDWGTYLLSQLVVYFPERLEKVVFMSIPFSPPGRATDIVGLNEKTRQIVGYEVFGYWLFLSAERAGKVIGENWESFFHVLYCADSSLWKTHMAPLGALEKSVTSKSKLPLASYVTAEDKAHHHAAFGSDYSGPCNWYVRAINHLGVDEEVDLLKRGQIKSTVDMEAFMITGTKDAVCFPERAEAAMKGACGEGKLVVKHLDAGHWVMIEQAEEVNRLLQKFAEGGVDEFKDGKERALL